MRCQAQADAVVGGQRSKGPGCMDDTICWTGGTGGHQTSICAKRLERPSNTAGNGGIRWGDTQHTSNTLWTLWPGLTGEAVQEAGELMVSLQDGEH